MLSFTAFSQRPPGNDRRYQRPARQGETRRDEREPGLGELDSPKSCQTGTLAATVGRNPKRGLEPGGRASERTDEPNRTEYAVRNLIGLEAKGTDRKNREGSFVPLRGGQERGSGRSGKRILTDPPCFCKSATGACSIFIVDEGVPCS